MAAIVTKQFASNAVDQFIKYIENNKVFMVVGHGTPWPELDINNTEIPPILLSTETECNALRKNAIYGKRLTSDQIKKCIRRFDWIQGTVYTPYTNQFNLLDHQNWLSPSQPFYVKNSQNRVYKCLYVPIDSEGEYIPSEYEPTGTGSVDNNTLTTNDLYIWKFMYEIPGTLLDFVNDEWMIVPENEDFDLLPANIEVHTNASNPINQGNVDRIEILTGGSGYIAGSIARIVGDGVGATVNITLSGGSVSDIEITNPGYGYTWAELQFSGLPTEKATYNIILSPFKGHGSNAIIELGASLVMMLTKFTNTENDNFSTSNVYRQIGLWANIYDKGEEGVEDPKLILAEDRRLSFVTTVEYTGDSFLSGTTFTVSPDPKDPRYGLYTIISGTILYDDHLGEGGVLGINNITGRIEIGDILESGDSIATITSISYPANVDIFNPDVSDPDNPNVIDLFSGTILYTENILPVSRGPGQTETIRAIIEF